jgi:DNA polymerase (family 10)
MQLHEELGVNDLDDLLAACEDHRVRDLDGFGPKTERKILAGIRSLQAAPGGHSLKEAGDYVGSLCDHLDQVDAVRRRGYRAVPRGDTRSRRDPRARTAAGPRVTAYPSKSTP